MRKGYGILKNIVWLTQLGLSVAAPLLVSVLGSVWLRGHFGLGNWIVALGAVLGVGASFASLWHNLKAMERQAKEDDPDPGANFNGHR